ncbi:4Fe-4S dicluster domain-containing protein [Desulfobacterium sp. N47]
MFYHIALYISLAIFVFGMTYKISNWFRRSIGFNAANISATDRVVTVIKGTLKTLLSAKIAILIRVFVLDIILQIRVLKESFIRWLMHMLIYFGFMMLFFMHAMDKFITQPIFPDYYSTLNPFLFLRDMFGLMVIIGICIAIVRRIILRAPKLKTGSMDVYAIFILTIIIFSGIFLESVKITSRSIFQEMVDEYSDLDVEEAQALEAFWVKNYGLVSSDLKGPFDDETLKTGAESHETNCASCHSSPRYALTGYAVAKVIKPFAGAFDRADMPVILWYIHFLSCFIGLAYLPFSKMFHIFASPISLLSNAVMDNKKSNPANIATRQILELDACTHCGTCSRRCSVRVAYFKNGNITVLPSEKMAFLKNYVANKKLSDDSLKTIQEGVYMCTNCDRCTVACPVGINLRELWQNVKEEMLQKGHSTPLVLSPLSFYRSIDLSELDPADYIKPLNNIREKIANACGYIEKSEKIITLSPINKELKLNTGQSYQANNYSCCFSCENCSTVCPVVRNYENPEEVLGMLPHQIMRSLDLGLKDLALGSKMLWDCVTCYQCQEHCPQGVKVTEVFYELKNMALKEASNL